ncbi:hypothetical protein BDN72DRAFT_954992 [Pluteus cervinus]|uniref:Uncharacterized protein n=1 Tax=Pluteus cervinus TaxID=181527 RepID=A0ACD3BAL8_9AGAR|nr:hypothetical protein BDN72DRAFT_954992 [Pluteus cervinus]
MPHTEGRATVGPLAAPSDTTWRRERLLRIGSSSAVATQGSLDRESQVISEIASSIDETTSLHHSEAGQSYGTVQSSGGRTVRNSPLNPRRSLSLIPGVNQLYRTSTLLSNASGPMSPLLSPVGLRGRAYSRIGSQRQRPISAYDAPLDTKDGSQPETDISSRINGIRVWYSSFTSVDWLHDAIKDSLRYSRLRKRKSVRARIRLAVDRSMGWIIVTIVGFLTAIVAFLVVRSEQFLFDLKEGYCLDGWWKAKRFCCPGLDDAKSIVDKALNIATEEDKCRAWEIWAEKLSREQGVTAEIVEYISYTSIALLLALVSSLLTIYLTNSTTFMTRKESGVLSPKFSEASHDLKGKSTTGNAGGRKVMYYAAGSGIPEIKTILSGFVIHGYLGGRTLFTKSVGLALSVASGLSLGKEGPFVHIASCVGNIVSRFTSKYENNEAKRREILSAACAAGVAVAFGAPIGGTLFSLEEVSFFFPPKVMWRSFFCAMIAAITLKMLDPFGTGKLVLFQVTYGRDWHAYELFPFLLLGVFGGVYGAYFSKLNYRWSKNVRNKTWMKAHPILEVLLITFLTSVFCFLNPYTYMGGTELVYNLFAECRHDSGNSHEGLCIPNPGSFEQAWPVARAIIVAMIVKGALTIVTFGIKVPAGIFIPTLGVGACAGRVLGIGVHWLQLQHPHSPLFRKCGDDLDCIIPGLYAMVGAAATLSGVTRTTVSLAVIMFELTDTLTYAVPVMLSVLVAKTVADALEPKGIYDLVIDLSQLPYLDTKHEYLWGNMQINDVTARDVEIIRLDRRNTVESLRDQLATLMASNNDDSGFPIVRRDTHDDSLRLVGYIGAGELEHALTIVADHAEEEIHFHTQYAHHDMAASSVSSLLESTHHPDSDPFDFSIYMDQAPLTIQSNSPLELLHQFFVKLGARYVVITDTDGYYEGVIDKKTWLAFLSELEEKT